MTCLLNNVNHIVNFGSYVFPILGAIFFYYVGPRDIFFLLLDKQFRWNLFRKKKFLVKLQKKFMLPNIIVRYVIRIQINR